MEKSTEDKSPYDIIKVKPKPAVIGAPESKPQPKLLDVNVPEKPDTISDPVSGRSVTAGVRQPEDGYSANNYAELIEQLQQRMNTVRPLSREEVERMRRRQRTEGIIAGVSDAAQAISNLFFTTQYAPNMYNPKEGMSAKAQERFDRARAQREAEDDRYMNYALQIGKLRDAADAVRERRKQQGVTLQLAQQKAQQEAEAAKRLAALQPDKEREQKAKADKAEAEALKMQAAAEMEAARIMSVINRNNRSGRSGARGGKGRKYWLDTPNGREYYDNAAMFNAAVMRWSAELGLPDTRQMTTKSPDGDIVRDVSLTPAQKAGNLRKKMEKTPRVEIDWD